MATEQLPIITNYQIVREIGSGGMSTVYEAIDSKLKRSVAIKVLHAHLYRDGAAVERFRREALAAAKMNHPGIVRIYDYIYTHNTHCIVMEYVPGSDVETVLKEHGPLPFETARYIMHEVAIALQEAHGQGVLHRDVKPSNILLHKGSRVMLSDFGLARQSVDGRLTQRDAIPGTPCFMSPEQISGKEVTFSSDVYSWAVTYHNLLCGKLPYKHQNFPEVVADIQYGRTAMDEGVRQSVPPRHLELLERCLVADPTARVADGGELRVALDALSEIKKVDLTALASGVKGEGPRRPTDRDLSVTRLYRRNSRFAALKIMLGVLAVLAGGALLFWGALWYVGRFGPERPLAVHRAAAAAPAASSVLPPRSDSARPADSVTPLAVGATTGVARRGEPVPQTAGVARDSGQLFIYCSPWANIAINGREFGRTPMEKPIVLSRGRYLIRLYNDFCEPQEDEVEIVSGTVMRRRYTLQLKPAYQQ